MHAHRCPAGCDGNCKVSRRSFLAASASLAAGLLSSCSAPQGRDASAAAGNSPVRPIRQKGPASRCTPAVKVCFVRRKGAYGMRWPGAYFDGEAALRNYTRDITATSRDLAMKLDLRPQPLYTQAEADAWIAEADAAKPDGLIIVLLDRQEHAWPTADKAIATGIPTVVVSPLGTSFTTNTAGPARKPGSLICSTDEFGPVRYGMKMLQAGARLRATRCLVIRGAGGPDSEIPHLGIRLRNLPADVFIEEYRKTPDTPEVFALADDLRRRARRQAGATRQDVINGIRSYVVARTLLEREEADAITMDCLGALGRLKVSLPCIAWSKMNDDGIPAACEADLGAVATHCVTQYLFDRPGFQQDPVADTVHEAIIGAHCSCPTRLGGFGGPSEPYDIIPHHGARDATARPLWRIGQRVTMADVLLGSAKAPTQMVMAAGEVLDNLSVPPAGGCVVSVRIRFDGGKDVLTFPGFHQIFFYGDFKKELLQFCHLFKIEPVLT